MIAKSLTILILAYIPYCPNFLRDVNFTNHLKVDCLCFYFRECMWGISPGDHTEEYIVLYRSCV